MSRTGALDSLAAHGGELPLDGGGGAIGRAVATLPYRARRTLHIGADLLTDKQAAWSTLRGESPLFLGVGQRYDGNRHQCS